MGRFHSDVSRLRGCGGHHRGEVREQDNLRAELQDVLGPKTFHDRDSIRLQYYGQALESPRYIQTYVA